VLATIVSVAIVLAVAHLGGVATRRLGQPAVIGQLIAGVAIGPTVLGARSDDLLSDDTVRVVRDLGTVGLVAFAFSLGAKLDRAHLPRPHHFAAMAAAVFAVPRVVTTVATSPSLRLLGFRRVPSG
jgi:Kef-type K+ transport system membrane component KefB